MQIVYLSVRPEVLAGTIASVRAHMPFVDEVLVVAPAKMREQLAAGDVQVITDEELLGGVAPTDHKRRNFALRTGLAVHPAVDDVFMMSDDDSRPLRALDETTFLLDGRYRRYMFGWLDEWTHNSTSFDLGEQATRQILGLFDFPRRAYASHMPQVFEKAFLAEVAELMSVPSSLHPMDEWSTYFNIAPRLHPDSFHEPEHYLTLGWPENPAVWQSTVEPGAFLFENYFPEHYGPEAVFDNIDPEDHTLKAAIEKVVRWRDYELRLLTGKRDPIVGAPPPSKRLAQGVRRTLGYAVGNPVRREQRIAVAALLRATRRAK